MKTLYFEGAGMDFYGEALEQSDVGNFRIRTAFTNNEGKRIYLEMGNTIRYDFSKKKPKVLTEYALRIDHLHEITDDPEIDDCNQSRIDYDWKELRELDYSKTEITRWVNENLKCDFDTTEVIDWFYGYRVHGDSRTNNFMEDIELNHARAKERRAAYEKTDTKYREILNEKYSRIGLHEMDDESITVRVFAYEHLIKQGVVPRYERIEVAY